MAQMGAVGAKSLLFFVLARRALAGRADRHQAVRALADLPGDVLLKRGFVDGAVPERGDQRDKRPLEHGFLPALACGSTTIVPAAASFNITESAGLPQSRRRYSV